jgi:hypothetical protein
MTSTLKGYFSSKFESLKLILPLNIPRSVPGLLGLITIYPSASSSMMNDGSDIKLTFTGFNSLSTTLGRGTNNSLVSCIMCLDGRVVYR